MNEQIFYYVISNSKHCFNNVLYNLLECNIDNHLIQQELNNNKRLNAVYIAVYYYLIKILKK